MLYFRSTFQTIKETNIDRNKATIEWNEEWITFLDSLIQFSALSNNHDGVSTIKLVSRLTINIDEHQQLRSKYDQLYNAVKLKDIGVTK